MLLLPGLLLQSHVAIWRGSSRSLRAAKPVAMYDAPCFVLFADDDAEARTLVAKYGTVVDSAIRAPFVSDGLWLARRDVNVGLAAHAGEWDAARNYLERIGCASAGALL
jgi:hypothetical protein